ncbi:MAG: hypothetical protein IBX53_01305 [Halomonas sp.]|uniref:hypothetical protein n=1 Tax=Halomonas sp. TaxID=1486246 RepID=UPI0019EB420D|nr:hypothetical protein [Halomonas sp.]MBE0487689.1 hypothetical protein [Halomonas sp.]
MTQVVIWLIAFVAILFLTINRWSSVSPALDRVLPELLKSHGDNRTLWGLALAVLGATVLVRPVEILLTVLLIVIIGLVGWKLAGWAMNKVDLH